MSSMWRVCSQCLRAIRELTDLSESVIDMENFIIDHTDLRMDCTRKHLEGLCTPLKVRAQLRTPGGVNADPEVLVSCSSSLHGRLNEKA